MLLLSQSWEILKIIILFHLMPDNFIHQLEFVKSHNFMQLLNFDKLFQVLLLIQILLFLEYQCKIIKNLKFNFLIIRFPYLCKSGITVNFGLLL